MSYKTMKFYIIDKKQRLFWTTLLGTCLFMLVLWNYQPHMQNLYFKWLSTRTVNCTILYWDTFFGENDFSFGVGNDIFKDCLYSNCYATYDRNYIPVHEFSAIIFHGARFEVKESGVPLIRSDHQKYIFLSLESAYNCHYDRMVNNNFYNWTMTYKRDSDIHYPYSVVNRQNTSYKMITEDTFKRKTREVAWFVSNCATAGAKKRYQYVQELAKYISVDIYGSCGKLKCTNRKKCYNLMEHRYKFYLSFENSMCADYITEKLYNVLNYNVVPVVNGVSDYNALAPPNSVIKTGDFASPQALAQHLKSVGNNFTEYSKFLKWKTQYVIQNSRNYALCQLCELLNRELTYGSYDNVEEWFYKGCK